MISNNNTEKLEDDQIETETETETDSSPKLEFLNSMQIELESIKTKAFTIRERRNTRKILISMQKDLKNFMNAMRVLHEDPNLKSKILERRLELGYPGEYLVENEDLVEIFEEHIKSSGDIVEDCAQLIRIIDEKKAKGPQKQLRETLDFAANMAQRAQRAQTSLQREQREKMTRQNLLAREILNIENDEVFFCDYISFEFQTVDSRLRFQRLLQTILGMITLHDISIDSLNRFDIPGYDKDKIVGLTEKDPYKNLFYLHFAGKNSLKIYKNLFHPSIIEHLNLPGSTEKYFFVELKRLDFKTYLDMSKHQISDTASVDKLEMPYHKLVSYEGYQTFQQKENQEEDQEEDQEEGQEEGQGQGQPQSPDLKKQNPLRNLKVSFSKTLLNKFAPFWKDNNQKEFIKLCLTYYIEVMSLKRSSKYLIGNYYKMYIGPSLDRYMLFFGDESLLNNSIVSGIICKSQEQEFFLDKTTEFVSFLALYLATIKHAKLNSWGLQKFKRIPFASQDNIQTFRAPLSDLLKNVGLENHPYLRRKMKGSLLNLQSYSISSSVDTIDERKNQRKSKNEFHPLITRLDFRASSIEYSINMRVLVNLITSTSNVMLEIFSEVFPDYQKHFTTVKGKRKQKQDQEVEEEVEQETNKAITYPFYFYSLVAQVINSLTQTVVYQGNEPTSGSAIKHFEEVTLWLFQEIIPKYTSQRYDDLTIVKSANQKVFYTNNGSFTYQNFQKVRKMVKETEVPELPELE